MTAEQVAGLTGVDTGCGGTLSGRRLAVPQQLTAELLALAATRTARALWLSVETLSAEGDGWLLNQQRYHQAVVLANGHRITGFAQTAQLPVYPVGGRQPYSPPRGLPCAVLYDGYLTPQNPQNQQHCIGASYHRGKTDTTFSEEDQQHNRQRLIDCFPGAEWPQDVDISANDARWECAAPPAIIYRWSATCRTTRQH